MDTTDLDHRWFTHLDFQTRLIIPRYIKDITFHKGANRYSPPLRRSSACRTPFLSYDISLLCVSGFLKTGPEWPAAAGDVVLALTWLKENIGSFGGDPRRVTLIGHDTGASLANLILIAPQAKGQSHFRLSSLPSPNSALDLQLVLFRLECRSVSYTTGSILHSSFRS